MIRFFKIGMIQQKNGRGSSPNHLTGGMIQSAINYPNNGARDGGCVMLHPPPLPS